MIIKIVGLVILVVVVTYNQIIDLLGIIVEFVRLVILVVIVIPNISQHIFQMLRIIYLYS